MIHEYMDDQMRHNLWTTGTRPAARTSTPPIHQIEDDDLIPEKLPGALC
jgi:hypothetical protein